MRKWLENQAKFFLPTPKDFWHFTTKFEFEGNIQLLILLVCYVVTIKPYFVVYSLFLFLFPFHLFPFFISFK